MPGTCSDDLAIFIVEATIAFDRLSLVCHRDPIKGGEPCEKWARNIPQASFECCPNIIQSNEDNADKDGRNIR